MNAYIIIGWLRLSLCNRDQLLALTATERSNQVTWVFEIHCLPPDLYKEQEQKIASPTLYLALDNQ